MPYVSLNEPQIKELFKQAFLELLQEQRSFLYDLFMEVIEDFALARAIEEGKATEPVTRAEVFQILESTA